MGTADLESSLAAIVGADGVSTDDDALELATQDLHVVGQRPLAVVRPTDAARLAAVVAAATSRGIAVVPRGGGLSYTGGYASPTTRAITIDMRGMDRIVALCAEDMTVTVQAGVTWKQIRDALAPAGLRLPYLGTFSGAGATVGGGLSQGALFFGSARYGSAADNVLGLEVALADGTLLRTGQGAIAAGSKPFLRSFGPDLTGLFTHDAGMLGIKTEATFRIMESPSDTGFLSFAFADLTGAAQALSAIARADVAEEVYVLDPGVTDAMPTDVHAQVQTAAAVARAAGGKVKAALALAGLARAGTDFIPPGHFSLHMTAAGRSAAAVDADLDRARALAAKLGGSEVAATIPRVARATLFENLNGVLGPRGGRWTALNAKVAHSDALRLIAEFDTLSASFAQDMAARGVTITRLASALGNHCFSFEPVFHWQDSWTPLQRAAADAAHLARFTEPAPDPAARALVDRLRRETVDLFRRLGAASNQIGRTYPFRSALSPAPEALLAKLKDAVDPRRLMNPGVLGF